MLKINENRLLRNITELSLIGKDPEGGITRPAFSPPDMMAREWLIDRIQKAGLQCDVDGAGNIFATVIPADAAAADKPAVMCGSHIDTVPNGGALDGALGVLTGLEALQVIKEEKIALARPLKMVAFSDEEGRFGEMIGSRAFSGQLDPAHLTSLSDVHGVLLADAMRDSGYNVNDVAGAKASADAYEAFVELHIEQGPVLERKGISVGVVDAIVGLFKWQIDLYGQANHAGTTPMNMRRDAFYGGVKFADKVRDLVKEHGGADTVATIGKFNLYPGAPNVVPGHCRFFIEARDRNKETLDHLKRVFRDHLKRCAEDEDLTYDVTVLEDMTPVQCDPQIMDVIESCAAEADVSSLRMFSGAAHDAQNMAALAKVGMIFVPSIGGISHNPAEYTDDDDIVAGATVMVNTLAQLVL